MKFNSIFFLFLICFIFNFSIDTFSQSQPLLYMCVRYGEDGEEGISDRFTTGALTVMVKCERVLGLSNVTIQYDKYNFRSGKFEYYKQFKFDVDSDMKYIYFAKSSTNDMRFDDPGFYRVFLLDERDKTVASCLVEIIR